MFFLGKFFVEILENLDNVEGRCCDGIGEIIIGWVDGIDNVDIVFMFRGVKVLDFFSLFIEGGKFGIEVGGEILISRYFFKMIR